MFLKYFSFQYFSVLNAKFDLKTHQFLDTGVVLVWKQISESCDILNYAE